MPVAVRIFATGSARPVGRSSRMACFSSSEVCGGMNRPSPSCQCSLTYFFSTTAASWRVPNGSAWFSATRASDRPNPGWVPPCVSCCSAVERVDASALMDATNTAAICSSIVCDARAGWIRARNRGRARARGWICRRARAIARDFKLRENGRRERRRACRAPKVCRFRPHPCARGISLPLARRRDGGRGCGRAARGFVHRGRADDVRPPREGGRPSQGDGRRPHPEAEQVQDHRRGQVREGGGLPEHPARRQAGVRLPQQRLHAEVTTRRWRTCTPGTASRASSSSTTPSNRRGDERFVSRRPARKRRLEGSNPRRCRETLERSRVARVRRHS